MPNLEEMSSASSLAKTVIYILKKAAYNIHNTNLIMADTKNWPCAATPDSEKRHASL
jgi:hypothetical protein